jgi:hypothetical protein
MMKYRVSKIRKAVIWRVGYPCRMVVIGRTNILNVMYPCRTKLVWRVGYPCRMAVIWKTNI